MEALFAWIGTTDLKAAMIRKKLDTDRIDKGPIAAALEKGKYDKVILLSNWQEETDHEKYKTWIEKVTNYKVTCKHHHFSNPTDLGKIYTAAVQEIQRFLDKHASDAGLTFHISPGTPSMAAIWVILAKTKYRNAKLIESSVERGVNLVNTDFELDSAFIREQYRRLDKKLAQSIISPTLKEFVAEGDLMKGILYSALKVARKKVPIFISGETGTGKEAIAKIIHDISGRKGSFIAVNCGAIPEKLFESELFGHVKGAFTGADSDKKGYIAQAEGGTLFLDEIADLPLLQQVKLNRVIQEKEYTRVGDAKGPIKADFALISATHKNLIELIRRGDFRDDLFWRLYRIIIPLPALKARGKENFIALTNIFVNKINSELSDSDGGYIPKTIPDSVLDYMFEQEWDGNIRQLENLLWQVMALSDDPIIQLADIQKCFVNIAEEHKIEVDKVNVNDFKKLNEEILKENLQRALETTGGNLAKTAKLLGFKSRNNVIYWMRKFKL